jgi:uncharacterized metal-binding protein YceD (DUF177 family)
MTKRDPAADGLAERPWSVPVARAEVPDTGRHFELVAAERTREAIAKLANLRVLPQLSARFDVAPHGREGLRVTGRIAAILGQTCVVTLEPIENALDEPVDIVFAPAAAADVIDESVDITADDPPEALVDGAVDLGAIATEFMMLAVDPYPRKADAVFEPPAAGDPPASPFAALAALKPRRQDGDEG